MLRASQKRRGADWLEGSWEQGVMKNGDMGKSSASQDGEGQAPPSQETGNRKAVTMMSFMSLAFNMTGSLAKAWFEACPTAVRALFELAQRQFFPPSLC